MKLKIRKTPKNAMKISIILLIIISVLLIIVNIIPNNKIQIQYGFKMDNGYTPIWKIVCYIIILLLSIVEIIITRIMCRCEKCKKYIFMNIHTEYCPYCSKKIED